MIRLHQDRLALLRKYLKESQVNPALFEELLDHLACEAEERLWDGAAFEEVLKLIEAEASPQILLDLNADLRALLEEEQSLTDMVFEGRNKQYGAYDLRKGYGHTIQHSLVMGVSFFLLLVLLPDLYARLTPSPDATSIGYELELNRVDIRPTVTLDLGSDLTSQPESALDEVIHQEPISLELPVRDTDETASLPILIRPTSVPEEAVLPHAQQGWMDPNDWHRKPEFPGGVERLMGYIETQLEYPLPAIQNKVEGRVMVEFTINPEGRVQDVNIIEGIGYGCDQVAKKIVATMPNWKPGNKSGKPTSYRYILPVSFQINK
ncbi:energy transducer TonB [Dyadobacter tibetensis]|uniref:energy transducer TonB n=1 Tax=Dyadobacter tibetensis TaxID=1211851 RepID=UPI0004726CB1|nr:energy transducer TonB [Dyadobacter tibetensis]